MDCSSEAETVRLSGNGKSGRYRLLQRCASISDTRSADRFHNQTSRPARAKCKAIAVPQEPEPITAIFIEPPIQFPSV